MNDNYKHTLSGMLAINKRLQRGNIKCRLLTTDFNNFWALLSRACASPVVWREGGGKSVPPAKQGHSHRQNGQLHRMAIKFA